MVLKVKFTVFRRPIMLYGLVFMLLYLSPLILFLIISIAFDIIYWRRAFYFLVFVLGFFAFSTGNLLLLVLLWIGIMAVFFMKEEDRTRFPSGVIASMVLLFLIVSYGLNALEVIEMNAGAVFVRFWPVIPLVLGLIYLFNPRSDFKTGLVLLEIAGIFIFLNALFYMGEGITVQNPVFAGIIILFWPAFLFLLAVDAYRGWKESGDRNYINFLTPRLVTGKEWSPENTSLLSVLGKLTFELSEQDLLFKNVRKKSIRISGTAVLGKVEIRIPRDTVIVSDDKKMTNFPGKSKRAIIKGNYDRTIKENDKIRLIINTRRILGTVERKLV